MKIKGWELNFFNSGEWQVCDERLKELERTGKPIGSDGFNPGRKSLFEALRATPSEKTRVCIIGQDPYSSRALATGLAFSIPAATPREVWPPTLQTIFKEYHSDLGYRIPDNGDLSRWATQGVLLWNAIPSCGLSRSLSHDWTEWSYLTGEIIDVLNKQGVVFALVGQVARRFASRVDLRNNMLITTSHPSPRGMLASKTPFLGSRLFSTINARLVENALEPVDWKLE